MSTRTSVIVFFVGLASALGTGAPARAQNAAIGELVAPNEPPMDSKTNAPLQRPEWLPHYDLDIQLDTSAGTGRVRQIVRWTNPGNAPTDHMLFHVYARHKPSEDQMQVYERIIESFRLDPKTAIDKEGRRLQVRKVRSGNADLRFTFDEKIDTIMRVDLPAPVQPGETVEITLEYDFVLPPVQGRFGQFRGVTNLLNWYPLVAFYGKNGWDAPPFVGWHQPWLNEAGNYDVKLSLPSGEEVATSGTIVGQEPGKEGWKTVTIKASGLRDFALVTSKRFEVHEAKVRGVHVRVVSFPEHRFYARLSLETAVECLQQYGDWFGPYPHPTYTIAESYFGWNGNETAGMVLIDERVFDAPHVGHIYVDHLVSHETLHQWWYATVGTDGFRETFIDEGLVSFLTQMRIKEKYGKDVDLLDWPKCVSWLPNISYEAYIHAGYYLFLGRAGEGRTLANLLEMGHVHKLFFLAYERGSRIFGMLHHRMGHEKFMEFFRFVHGKYQFRVFFMEDLERELNEFTGTDFSAFFDDWCRTSKITDWKVDDVDCEWLGDKYRVTVNVSQRREIDEPVQIGYQLEKGGPFVRLFTIQPDAGNYTIDDATVTKKNDHHWELTFESPTKPKQIVIDPDHRILDANLANNRWRFEPKIRFTPFYTPLDEIPLVNPLDQPSIVFGPGVVIDQQGRMGMRGSLIFANRYRVSPYIAYTGQDAQIVSGIDLEIFNVPLPNVTFGATYEHTLMTALFNDPMDQGKLYLRWNQIYTTSFIYPNLAYVETYFRFGDNFWPDEDFRPPIIPGVEDYRNIRAVGIAYHFNTQTPYWNPEKGFSIDAYYENGFPVGQKGESFNRVWSQVAAVHLLPEGLGYFSDTRLAGRLAGGVGSPDNGEHFRFGGATRFRGQRSEDTEGSMEWLASVDWRFPVCPDLDVSLYDNIANWRSLYASLFYDVGESFLLDQSQGVDHAVGAGLYFRLALFSFVEQLTLRLEYAHSLGTGSQIAWFGVYQAY